MPATKSKSERSSKVNLTDSVQYVKGIGPVRAEALGEIGVETVEDLLYYIPRRYLDRSTILPIAKVRAGATVTVIGRGVVVAPVSGLDALAEAVGRATAAVGRPPDPRPFLGHVTLARCRDDDVAALAGQPMEGSWTATEVALVASERHADRPRYRTVARQPLR